jgi:hypothetical protein
MGVRARFVAVSVTPGLVVAVFTIGKSAYEARILGACDAKFGCAGGIQFAALISGIALVLSLVGCAFAARIQLSAVKTLSGKALTAAIAAASVVLLLLFQTVPSWPYADVGLMVWWLVASGILCTAAIAGARYVRI